VAAQAGMSLSDLLDGGVVDQDEFERLGKVVAGDQALLVLLDELRTGPAAARRRWGHRSRPHVDRSPVCQLQGVGRAQLN
jgi:hypothetical protein